MPRVLRQGATDPSTVLNAKLWKHDGSTFYSDDAYGHLCTVTGALWSPQGRYFDGVDDYIDVGLPLGANSSGTKAIGLWVNPPSAAAGYLITNYHALGGGFSVLFNADRTIGISWTGVANVVQTVATIPLNTWTHFLGVFSSGTTGGKIYLNGVVSVSGDLGAEATNTNKIRINGRWVTPDTGSAALFVGSIGEVLIHNRFPTPAEIQNIYLSTKWRYS